MLTIDGSHGEGGGQIIRSSLALALATAADENDRDAVQIWDAADRGDCAAVVRLSPPLRARAPDYFRTYVRSVPTVAACLHEGRATAPPPTELTP